MLYPATLLNLLALGILCVLMCVSVVCVDYKGFSVYRIMSSANRGSFTSAVLI